MDEELDEHRETRIQDGLKALWNAMVRLFVHEVSTSELPWDVAQIFSRLEISLLNVRVWKVLITGDMEEHRKDDAALRGGFTTQERREVNKIPLSLRCLRQAPNGRGKNRILEPPVLQFNVKGATVVLDAKGKPVCISIHNALQLPDIEAREHFVKSIEEQGKLAWCKGCGLSGLTRRKCMMEQFLHNAEVTRSYFGGKHSGYSPQDIVSSTKSGKPSDSTRLAYKNLNYREASFQVGNFIPRHIVSFTNVSVEHVGFLCLTTVINYLKMFNLCLRFTQKVTREDTPAVDISEEPMTSFKHAINRFEAHQTCQPANHQDSTVCAACGVSSFVEGGELSSKNVGGEAGLLFRECGCVVIPYGARDFIMFCGNSFHCPLPVHPKQLSQPGNKRKRRKDTEEVKVKRYSIATFLGNKVKSPVLLESAEVNQSLEIADFVPEDVKDYFSTYKKCYKHVVNQCRHDNVAVPIMNPRQLEQALRKKKNH